MKKAKRTFINTPKANRVVGRYDFSHMGFALLHEEKILYALECTDEAIRNGNEILLKKAVELADMYPDYTCGVLHIMFAG